MRENHFYETFLAKYVAIEDVFIPRGLPHLLGMKTSCTWYTARAFAAGNDRSAPLLMSLGS